jgi:hypothetical protein
LFEWKERGSDIPQEKSEKERMAEIKERIAFSRKEMLEPASQDEDSNKVVQINIQAFPMTE